MSDIALNLIISEIGDDYASLSLQKKHLKAKNRATFISKGQKSGNVRSGREK